MNEQPFWKQLTKQDKLEAQYDVLKGSGKFTDREIALHLARFAEAHPFNAADKYFDTLITKHKEELAALQAERDRYRDTLASQVDNATKSYKRWQAENHELRTQLATLTAENERLQDELAYANYMLEDARSPEFVWDDERIDAQVQDFGMGDAARRGMRVMRNEYEKQLHLLRRQLYWWEEEHKAMKNPEGANDE